MIRILERAHDTIVGTLQQSRNFFYVVPDDPRLVHNVYVQSAPRAAARARRQGRGPVWSRGNRATSIRRARSSRSSGRASAPGVDMLSIIRKYHLPTEFPQGVLDEAEPHSGNSRSGARPRAAKICASNLSSRSIRMTRATSMTRSMWRSRRWGLAAWRSHRRCCRLRDPGSALDREALQARQQRLSAGPRHPDVARAIEQRRLQPESGRRSADAFRLHPLR